MVTKRGSHCVYDPKYHFVWAEKYRKWILRGEIRERVRERLIEISEHRGFEIEALEVDKDHVHIFSQFSTKASDIEGCEPIEGSQCERDTPMLFGGKEVIMGRRILGRRAFYLNCGG